MDLGAHNSAPDDEVEEETRRMGRDLLQQQGEAAGGWALGKPWGFWEREAWSQQSSIPSLPLMSGRGFKRDKGRTGQHWSGAPGSRGSPALPICTPTHDPVPCFTGSKVREERRTEQEGDFQW